MRISHFEALRPICPYCRGGAERLGLKISIVEAESKEDLTSGILGCPSCGQEYPVIDGMPIIVPDVRRYIQDNLFYLMARDDLSPGIESLLGDAAGPGSGLESIRQHVSSYMWDHWGDRDPSGPGITPAGAKPGCIVRNLAEGLEMISADLPEGPILDIGCGTGRTVVELAERSGKMVLGIDLSVPLARRGRQAAVHGRVEYALRRGGLVYERRQFDVPSDASALVDIWICDVMALPFDESTFALATAMNVIDCVRDPRAALVGVSQALSPGGEALVSLPFDWAGQVTPPEAWLGGHSQRAPHGGDPRAILDMLLQDGPLAAGQLRRHGKEREVDWQVRLHDRSCMQYTALMVAARQHPG